MTDVLVVSLLVTVVAGAGIGGACVALKVRRWSRQDDQREPFTLQELREMRARHEISEQEFQALRGQLLGRAAARLQR
jgi:uncharacterized membrane protein